MKPIVARFAPSPTGLLHIGGIRTALINYIYIEKIKKKIPNSKLLLRIEDTDKIRSKDEYTENIIEGLKWIGIKWDGEILIQSQRKKRHEEIALKLLNIGKAFKCICKHEELEKKRKENQKKNLNIKKLCNDCEDNSEIQNLDKGYCIRIKIPDSDQISINDKIQGLVTVQNSEIDNYIIIREDGTPTYMLSVVVDDYDMGVNAIIRGDDHFNNTFRQIYIYKYMQWDIPNFAHLPLIHGEDGSKLSKRHGAVDISKLKEMGYLPQSIINNLILLGWSPKKDNEIIEISEIVDKFEIEKLSKSSSIFNYSKLNHFNNFYLSQKENFKYFEDFIKNNDYLNKSYIEDKNKIIKIFDYYKSKINIYNDLNEIIKIYFDESFKTIDNDKLNKSFNKILSEFKNYLDKIEEWNVNNIENAVNKFIKEKKLEFKNFGIPMRIILTNSQNGPSISHILDILGKKKTFLRINNYIDKSN